MPRITINSILGGESVATNLAGKGQFSQSLGIDPAYPIDSAKFGTNSMVQKASGILRPVGATKFSGTTLTSAPMWMVPQPKTPLVYMFDINGSAYSIDPTGPTVTALSDAGTLSGSTGSGCEYYDNYIYFSTGTDLVRYGPLNGSAGFQASYWQGTLGKSALALGGGTLLPTSNNLAYPKMVLKRHSDGKMYIAHSSGNQGAISFVSTTKTSVEGDTDNGSTFGKLLFGYGLLPTTIESYAGGIAIALSEGGTSTRSPKAKLAFWDTTSQNFNSMLWVEFPDQFISAMKNIDGVLYIWSGNYLRFGCRVSRYVGGYSIKEVAYYENAISPMQGAVDGTSTGIVFGSTADVPEASAALYSIGLHKTGMSTGQFKIMRATGASTGSTVITSILLNNTAALSASAGGSSSDPWIGWSNGTATDGTKNGLDQPSDDTSSAPAVWQSQQYSIGEPFTIDRIRIPMAQIIAAGMTITPKLYFDNKTSSTTLPVINSTNFTTAAETSFGLAANFKLDQTGANDYRGENNFMLELRWTGTTLATVDLPIIVDFTVIPD